MGKVETYREHLRQMCDWEFFLLAESRLPGPRGNLELARAAADEGDATQFARWLAVGPAEGPTNTPGEFLAFCGALGYGRLLAEGDRAALGPVRQGGQRPALARARGGGHGPSALGRGRHGRDGR